MTAFGSSKRRSLVPALIAEGSVVLAVCVFLGACGSQSPVDPNDAGGAEGADGGSTSAPGGDGAGGSASGGTGASGGATHGGAAGGGGGFGAVGGTGGAPVSCEDFSCPDLGTCGVIRDGEKCSRVCQFDEAYPLRSDEEVSRLAELECEIIEGDLSLYGSDHDETQPLPDLGTIREVTGSVQVGSAFWLPSLTGLERIGCVLYVSSFTDVRVEFPALAYVGVGLALNQTYGLQVASFPSLVEVGYGGKETCGEGYVPMGLLFYINQNLAQIDMPALRRVNERIYVGECPTLEAICFPSLTEVDPAEGIATEITLGVLDQQFVCLPSELSETLSRDAACPPTLCQ